MPDTKISADPAAAALDGTELHAGVQSASNVKITGAQIKTYVSNAPTLITPNIGAATGTSLVASGGVSCASLTISGTLSSLLKTNGSGVVSGAVSGTDYAPATSGSSILYGNGSGGFSNVTIGANLTFVAGTLAATAGGGGTPGGSNTQVQFNDSSVFGGDAGLTYNKTTDTLTIVGGVVSPLIQLGGTTSLFPSIKRSSGILAFRLADDSADCSISLAGATFSDNIQVNGKIGGTASTTSIATIGIPHGVAPTSPFNGDVWTTTSGMFVRINGATVGPLATGGGGAPGGSSGDIQYNNAGAFGGITPTGTGAVVRATSPTLVTPALGTPTAIVLTSATGLPLTTGVTGTLPVANGGSGTTTATGTAGSIVLSNSPSLVTPNIGAASGSSLTLTGNAAAGAAGFFFWTGRSAINAPADGNVRLTNSAQTDFGLLQLGGTTSSFPAVKRSSAALAFRLADDSADAAITAAAITSSGVVTGTGFTLGSTLVRTGTGSPESVVTAPIGSLYLRTDGGAGTIIYEKATGAGNTGWVANAASSGAPTPGGSDTQVQFNDAGSMAGDAGLTYNKTTDALTIAGAAGVGGVLTTSSGQIQKVRVVTGAGAVTVATTDYIIIVNKASGASTAANLPAGSAGMTFIIKDGKGDAATNNITITPAAGTIDGAATYVMNSNYSSNTVVHNGTEWNLI